jgi:hypothetical protein
MRKINIFTLIFIAVVSLVIAVILRWDSISRAFVYPYISYAVQRYAAHRWGAVVEMDSVGGSIVSGVKFEGLRIRGWRGAPAELWVSASSVWISYSPISLLFGRADSIIVSGATLSYRWVTVPLQFGYDGRKATVWVHSSFESSGLKGLLPDGYDVEGLVDISGSTSFSSGRQDHMNISLRGKKINIEIAHDAVLLGRVFIDISGTFEKPSVRGFVDVSRFEFSRGVPFFSAKGGGDSGMEYSDFFYSGNISVEFFGKDIRLSGDNLQGRVGGSVYLKKRPRNNVYLAGKVTISKGSYNAAPHAFSITRGEILFPGEGKSARINIAGSTRIKKYAVFARLIGDMDDSKIVFTSKPSLPQAEIMALLVMGKRLGDLTIPEKDRLASSDFNKVFIDNFFLGRAEAKLAQIIGVDDIAAGVTVPLNQRDSTSAPVSVEVGKYLPGDRAYVSYSATAPESRMEYPEQSASGEVSVTDNLSIQGQRVWKESVSLPQEDTVTIKFRWNF